LTKKKHILWLDDDDILKMIANQIILSISDRIEGYQFLTNGEEALAYLEKCEKENNFPHLLLIDLNMPEMDGIEFLSHYRSHFLKKFPDTHVYVVTSSMRSSDMEKIKAFSFVNDYLVKPLTLQLLRQLLDQQ
jgi:CheY-like chemotaxis protein